MIVTEGGGISKTLSASQCWSNASWVGFFLYCSRHCGATETVRQGRSPLRHYNELNFKDLNIWWKKKISDLGEYSITRREDLKDLMLLAAASLAEGWNRWDCAEAHAALQQHICSPVTSTQCFISAIRATHKTSLPSHRSPCCIWRQLPFLPLPASFPMKTSIPFPHANRDCSRVPEPTPSLVYIPSG